MTQKVYIAIRDLGDGSQNLDWFNGKDITKDALLEKLEADEWASYQSGDGVQITTLEFPDNFDLSLIGGIYWESLNDDVDG